MNFYRSSWHSEVAQLCTSCICIHKAAIAKTKEYIKGQLTHFVFFSKHNDIPSKTEQQKAYDDTDGQIAQGQPDLSGIVHSEEIGDKSTKKPQSEPSTELRIIFIVGELNVFSQPVRLLQLGIAFNLFRSAHTAAEDMAFKT